MSHACFFFFCLFSWPVWVPVTYGNLLTFRRQKSFTSELYPKNEFKIKISNMFSFVGHSCSMRTWKEFLWDPTRKVMILEAHFYERIKNMWNLIFLNVQSIGIIYWIFLIVTTIHFSKNKSSYFDKHKFNHVWYFGDYTLNKCLLY